MNNNLKYISFEIICFGICLLNLFYNIIPQLILYIIIIASAIKRLNKYVIAFFCLVFLKDVNHAVFFFNYNISFMAYITIVIALVMMFKFLLRNKKEIFEKGKYLWIFMLFFMLTIAPFCELIAALLSTELKNSAQISTSPISASTFVPLTYIAKELPEGALFS